MKLTPHPDYAQHYRIWSDGREVGYLRKADEVTPAVWRACDDAGQRVVESSDKGKALAAFEKRYLVR